MIYVVGKQVSNNKYKFYQKNKSWSGCLTTAKVYKDLKIAYKNLVRLNKKVSEELEIYKFEKLDYWVFNRGGCKVNLDTLKIMNMI